MLRHWPDLLPAQEMTQDVISSQRASQVPSEAVTSDSSFEVHSMHGLAWLVEARPGTGVAVLGRDHGIGIVRSLAR